MIRVQRRRVSTILISNRNDASRLGLLRRPDASNIKVFVSNMVNLVPMDIVRYC